MAYAELRDTLRIRLPGALDGGINLELFNVIDEFCRQATAYRETLSVPLVAGTAAYPITPADREILVLYHLRHPSLDARKAVFDDGVLTLDPVPTAEDAADPLEVDVSLSPAYGTGDPEDWLPPALYQRFHQALLDGVLSRMHGQAAKPYSDVRRGTFHGQRFRNAIRIATARAVAPHTQSPQTWRFPRYGR
jgi:hypothetical protein